MTFYKGQRVLYLGKKVRVAKTGPTKSPHTGEKNVWVTYGKKNSKPFPVLPKNLKKDPDFPDSAMQYCERRQELTNRLARLVKWLDGHAEDAMKNPNWGHSGDLGGIMKKLGDIEESCGLDRRPLENLELLPIKPL